MKTKELPFSDSTNRFIASYLDTEDLARAAILSGLSVTAAQRLYRDKASRACIDKHANIINREQAQLTNRMATIFLDAQLISA